MASYILAVKVIYLDRHIANSGVFQVRDLETRVSRKELFSIYL